ncbi:MAG TPA: ABC transporter substrate-binding protein [Syntrophorhabdaceae bacterium]
MKKGIFTRTGTAAVVCGLLLFVILTGNPGAEPLRVGVAMDIKTALVRIAHGQGFFKKQGIDVVLKEYESGAMAIDDLTADKLDWLTAAEFVFVVQNARHRDLRMAATIGMAADIELMIRKDHAIARPADLKGKRVAINRGSMPEFFFYTYLIYNRIPIGSVRIVNLAPSEMVKQMRQGTIDAAVCWPPYTTTMVKQLGPKVARWPVQGGQEYYFTLIAKEGFLKKEPKRTERFMAALAEAESFLLKYPDKAKAVLRDILKQDAEGFLENWSRTFFQLQLTQDLLVLMEREAKWAMRNNLLEKGEIPNYLDFIYFDALDKVKPQAVSIVH